MWTTLRGAVVRDGNVQRSCDAQQRVEAKEKSPQHGPVSLLLYFADAKVYGEARVGELRNVAGLDCDLKIDSVEWRHWISLTLQTVQ